MLLDLSLIFSPELRFFSGGIMLRCRSVDRTSPSDFLAVSRHFASSAFYHLHPLSTKLHPFSEKAWRSALSYCSHHVIRATRLPHALTICYPWMTRALSLIQFISFNNHARRTRTHYESRPACCPALCIHFCLLSCDRASDQARAVH